jgi:hypothetical protein
MDFSNVTWAFDTTANGGVYAYAWNTDTGSEVANVEGADKIDAGKKLYAALARWAKAKAGATLVSKNGDRLTADGPLNPSGAVSNAF